MWYRPHVEDVTIATVFAALNWKREHFHICTSAAGYTDTDFHFIGWGKYFNGVYLTIFPLLPSLSLQDNRKAYTRQRVFVRDNDFLLY